MCSERGLLVALLLSAGALRAQELPTPAEALALAFGDAKVERTTAVLDEAMRKKVAAGEAPVVVFPYVATRDGKVVGTAYFDTHRVRQQKETLMVVVDPHGAIVRVEVVGFAEPREYLPKKAFYDQFPGRRLGGKQPLEKDLRLVAGATLTSRATIDASKRVLAVHGVLQEAEAAKQKDGKDGGGRARDAPGPGGGPGSGR